MAGETATQTHWQNAQTGEPVWMAAARAVLGLREDRDNGVIVGWAKGLGSAIANYFKDARLTPWCGEFVDHILTVSGIATPGGLSLGALNWRTWGRELHDAVPGAVLVFSRAGGGHVGFYVAEDAVCYHVLGGNQSNSVCIERIAKMRCVAVRWPSEVPVFGAPKQRAASDAALSTSEA